MTEWMDIATAPKDGTPILVFYPNLNRAHLAKFVDVEYGEYGYCGERRRYWFVIEEGWVDRHWSNWPTPSHWMPLPEPPID